MAGMDWPTASRSFVPWWKAYLSALPHRGGEDAVEIPEPTTAAVTLPFLLLMTSLFCSTFIIFSNERYLDRIVDDAMTHATTREQRETLELNREGNKQILDNPAIRFVIASKVTLRYALSFSATLFLFWLTLAGMSGRWDSFAVYWLIAMSSTAMLLLAAAVMFLLRWFFFLGDHNLSLGFLLTSPDFSGVPFRLLSQLDLFNLWFLWLLSSRLSPIYRERTATLFVVFVSLLVIEILFSSLVGVDFVLGS